jgi:uncharacterized SAM-binding protein YcdF (DUF218 family)
MWNFLVVNQTPKPSDIIVVLSGGGYERVDYGVKLLQQGYADELLTSGGSSENLRLRAVSLGVPGDHILVENKSGTTFGNAKYSSKIIRAEGFKSVIVVTSPYHTRRARMLFEEFSQGWDLTICAVPYDPAVATDWWKDSNLFRIVISEYLKFGWHFLFER